MVSPYQISSEAIAQIKVMEGFRARATQLADGRWTVGHGHVASTHKNSVVTRQQADLLLRYDLNVISEALQGMIFTPLNANQIDALGSLVYNIGIEAFRTSSVLRLINEGALLQAAAAMEQWHSATVDGQSIEVDGLIRRRASEKALFLKPQGGWVPVPSHLLVPQETAPVLSPVLSQDWTRDEPVAPPVAPPVPLQASPDLADITDAAPDVAPEPDIVDDEVPAVAAEASFAEAEPLASPLMSPAAPASVARRASQKKTSAKPSRKRGAAMGGFGRTLRLCVLAVAGVAAMAAAVSLGLGPAFVTGVRPEPMIGLWVLAVAGLGALAFAVAQLLGSMASKP